MPYCRHGLPPLTLSMVVARPHRDGERDANPRALGASRSPQRCLMVIGHPPSPRARPRIGLLLCRSVPRVAVARDACRGPTHPLGGPVRPCPLLECPCVAPPRRRPCPTPLCRPEGVRLNSSGTSWASPSPACRSCSDDRRAWPSPTATGATSTRACRTSPASTRTVTPTGGSGCPSTSTRCCSSRSTSR